MDILRCYISVRFTFRTLCGTAAHFPSSLARLLRRPPWVRNCCVATQPSRSKLLVPSEVTPQLRWLHLVCGCTGCCHLIPPRRPTVMTSVTIGACYILLWHHFMYQVAEIHRQADLPGMLELRVTLSFLRPMQGIFASEICGAVPRTWQRSKSAAWGIGQLKSTFTPPDLWE